MCKGARTILSLKTRALQVLEKLESSRFEYSTRLGARVLNFEYSSDSSPTRAQVKKMYFSYISHRERRFCVLLIIIQFVKTTKSLDVKKTPSASEIKRKHKESRFLESGYLLLSTFGMLLSYR